MVLCLGAHVPSSLRALVRLSSLGPAALSLICPLHARCLWLLHPAVSPGGEGVGAAAVHSCLVLADCCVPPPLAFTYHEFMQWLKTVMLPLIGLGLLSLGWEILSSMYR